MTTWGRSALRMMLRTPLQHAVADDDDDAVGHETADADDNHPRHHKVGARERTAVHDHGAKAGGHAGHLADHNQDPGTNVGDAKPVEERRKRGRNNALTEHLGARATRSG